MPLKLLTAGLLLFCVSAHAQTSRTVDVGPELVPPPAEIPKNIAPPPELPGFLRWMIHPMKDGGMFLNLPIIDTDPNRGITYGVMPIWVIPAKGSDEISQIHAPSLTYNQDFGFVPTYRYYYYPSKDKSFSGRASYAVDGEREVFAYYQDRYLFGKNLDFSLMTQYNVDGSNRFYGLGPDSPQNAQSDYTENVLQYDIMAGVPLIPDTPWMIRATNHFAGEKFTAGKLDSLIDTNQEFPGIFAQKRQMVMESRLLVDYDTRDSPLTTTHGQFLQIFAGASNRDIASQFDYSRYGFDGREFYQWSETEVTAMQLQYEQLLGNAPFWLEPRMGGKYSLRAYGDGRYVDRGMMTANIEQRISVMKVKMAGISTEFETGPFVGLGSVFDNPNRMAARYERPVYGLDVRAVARPQVVGSVDVGVGQEGVAVFMDINYSF